MLKLLLTVPVGQQLSNLSNLQLKLACFWSEIHVKKKAELHVLEVQDQDGCEWGCCQSLKMSLGYAKAG